MRILGTRRNKVRNFKEGHFYIRYKRPRSLDITIECGETTQSVLDKLYELKDSNPDYPILIKKIFFIECGKKIDCEVIQDKDGKLEITQK
jgi:hypothetical protein